MSTDISDLENLFQNAINAQTDPIKLLSCQFDYRTTGICFESWSENRQLPQLFVATVHTKDQQLIKI